jgi:hypothetical protein
VGRSESSGVSLLMFVENVIVLGNDGCNGHTRNR